MKKILRIVFSRVALVSVLILIQLFILFAAAIRFTEYFVYYYLFATVLALALTLKIVNRKDAAEYKIAWLTSVLLIPIFGGLLYLLFSGNRLPARKKKKMAKIAVALENSLGKNESAAAQIAAEDASAGFQSRYIRDIGRCPVFAHTDVRYFPLGEDMFAAFLAELEKAERYIFLEYFIIEEGKMWNAILEVLERKAAAGVDVRVIYDDMGCITLLPGDYALRLRRKGIRCHVFNRFIPILSARLNNRNHRKIGVIDGKVAFTGGINLADEYINEKERFGHWKDNAVMLRGEAAWSMTVMFLSMWDYLDAGGAAAVSYDHYKPTEYDASASDARGWVQPYTDNPLDDEPIGETIYLNMISRAEKYVYITTPYLIIDEVIEKALCTAAQCGIDVRIVTPGIGDKKAVYETTRSYYANLIRHGVKIYEYTPGFIHAKTFLSDDKYATVGTVNLDFRSLYLHFECGVWMYGCPALADIREDLFAVMEKSRTITEEDCRQNGLKRLGREIMALLAPMM